MRHLYVALAATALALSPAMAGEPTLELTGTPAVVFDTAHEACGGAAMPDLNARAFRDASGQTVVFALYDDNHRLVGPDLDHLKIDCRSTLGSPNDPDPAHLNDRNFVAATWTEDGRKVSALVHEEYHADQHGRCAFRSDLACWYNTIVAYRSADEGRDFMRSAPFVVASAPFRQDVEQGRHRGFFNPSNIVRDRTSYYVMISTTGWPDQPFGVCLFRSSDPVDPGSWRAFDGKSFSIRYGDPYVGRLQSPKPCETIAPFVFPVGSLSFHRASGTWIALFQAKAGGAMPLDGFYYAVSRDLRHWSGPKILLAAPTLYNDLCTAGPDIVGYPSLLDPASPSRNYDEVGSDPELFFARMDVSGCATGRRVLLRQHVVIRWMPKS